MGEIKTAKEKKGTQILFEQVTKESIDNIIHHHLEAPLLWCLKDTAKGDPNFYTKENGLSGGHNALIAYIILKDVGFITIPNKFNGDEKVELTDKGKKVYDALVKEGVYKKR